MAKLKILDMMERPTTWDIIDSTKMNAFLTCPRAFFYEYILGWRSENPNNHLVFGSAMHKALEYLYLTDFSIDSIMEAFNLFLKEYRDSFPSHTDEIMHPKIPDHAMLVLAAYAKHYKDDHESYKVLHTEIGGKILISTNSHIYFKMDTVLEDLKTGKVFSLEHKTASSLYMWAEQWDLAVQVGTYSHVLRCLFPPELFGGITMNALVFRKVIKGWKQLLSNQPLTVEPPYDFSRYNIKKTRQQMLQWQNIVMNICDDIQRNLRMLIEDDSTENELMFSFPQNPTKCINYGKICAYHDFCLAWSNPLTKCDKPPIGFKIEHWNPMDEELKEVFTL